jgi:phosphoglycolate phosphatase-like HAD superfamily hydrolase
MQRVGQMLDACEAVFFDIDGTLVDSNEFHVVAWAEAFNNNGRGVARHLLREQIGKGSDILIPSLFPGIGEAEQKTLSDAHGDIFRSRFFKLVRPFPSASELIHGLHERGKKVILVSSSGNKEVEHYIRLLGIKADLGGTVGSEDVNQTKPAADLFAMALRKAGVEGPDAIAVGDTPYDVQAAAKCKVQTIALRSGGFTDEQLNTTGPLAIAMDVNALFEDQDVLRGEDGHRHGCP